MPTTPMKAQPMPGPGAPREEIVGRALEMITNTAPFDITHHPAMAIPCGMADGLPVSVMLVGKHWDEPTIYRAAAGVRAGGRLEGDVARPSTSARAETRGSASSRGDSIAVIALVTMLTGLLGALPAQGMVRAHAT